MLLYGDIVNIEKPDGKCSLIFIVDEFSVLFLYPSILIVLYQTFYFLVSSEGIIILQKYLFLHIFMSFKFVFCTKGTKTNQTIKITIIFCIISLNNADNVFTAR